MVNNYFRLKLDLQKCSDTVYKRVPNKFRFEFIHLFFYEKKFNTWKYFGNSFLIFFIFFPKNL